MKLFTLFALFSFTAVSVFAQGSGYWHTQGSQILDSNNQPVRIAGVNWYGFETTDAVAHGLWAQDYKAILNTVKSNGYNTLRIPFSNQMVEQNSVPSNISFSNGSGAINTDLRGATSLAILDKIVAYAGQIGLRVILDNHRSEAGNSAEDNGLWYTPAYPQSAWVNDWVALANRYAGNTTVIGFDLRNEPHNSASWGSGDPNTDWRLAAELAGNQILAVNPHALIFVEGIQNFNGDSYWWGGNLEGAGQYPVRLNTANQLVYSAHDYGPAVYGQPWFNGGTTYSSLTALWTKTWAYLSLNNIAPVWVGEFGNTNNASDQQNTGNGSEGQWFQSMVQFLGANQKLSWTYWALNGEDSLGLLDSNYDPTPANAAKQQLLASIQFPLSGGGVTTPDFNFSASPASQTVTAGGAAQYTFTVAARNGFSGAVALGAQGVPANVTAGFSPAQISSSGTSTLTLSTNGATAAGTYTVSVTGTSGTLNHSASVMLTVNSVPVPDFTLSVNPGSQTVTAGGTANYTVTTSAVNGFTGTENLSVSGLPQGASAVFAPASLNGSGAATLSVYAAAATAAGTSALTVTATSGSLRHTASAGLTVQPVQTGGGCVVTWQVYSDWGAGFVTGITVANQGSTAINGWTLAWNFTGNQQITNLWNGALQQSGQSVRVGNASYNATIPAGGNQQLGFQAAYSGTNARPAVFTLNGQVCASK